MSSRKIYKRLISLLFFAVAVLLFCINALLLWVGTGPRSINALTPYIESALAPQGSGYKVEIGNSQLIWDGWQHPLSIHSRSVMVMNMKGAAVATFPEIVVRIDCLDLLIGEISVSSLEVLNPTAAMQQREDGSLTFGFSASPPSGAAASAEDTSLAALLGAFGSDNASPVSHLKSLSIRHAILTIKKKGGDVLLQSPDASLELTRRHGGIKGALTLPLTFDAKNGELDADLTLNNKDKTVAAEVIYTDIPFAVVYKLFPAQKWMEAIHMPLSGWANIISDYNGNIRSLDFLTEVSAGVIDYPDQFDRPLSVQRVRLEGNLKDQFTTLTMKKGLVDFRDFSIHFDGVVHKVGEDYSVDAHADTAHVPVDELRHYWPAMLSPHTREWGKKHVSKGIVEKATLAAHFKPGELKLKDTPSDAIDAMMQVKGATVQYLPGHPPVTDIDGIIKFTGDSMNGDFTSAKYMSGTEVASGHVRFPDLNAADVRLFLDINVNAPAEDVVAFLSLPDLDKAKKLNLTKEARGKVSGNAKVDFIAFSENEDRSKSSESPHINYAIAGNLEHVSQPGFMGNRNVEDANIKIDLNNKGIKAEGRAKVNQVPMTLNVATQFKNGETRYTVKCDMPVAKLPDYDLPDISSFAKGTLGIDASFQEAVNSEKVNATVNLDHAEIRFPEHGFIKKMGDSASLVFSTERLSNGNVRVPSFSLNGMNLSATGKGEFDKTTKEFSALSATQLRFGQTDLDMLDYARIPEGIKVTARGKSFNIAPYLGKSQGKDIAKPYIVDLKTNRLILGEGRNLENVTAQADCAVQCKSVNLQARLSDGTPLVFTIAANKLNSSCDNAGELMRSLGIFDGITGGKMTLNGAYSGSSLQGLLQITNYTLKHAPVLTKIFTIASLTGIVDTLSGNGIAFTKLTAPFVYQNDSLILKDAKTHGPALGLTVDGTVDMRDSKLDLQGTLVPSYTLNSMAGNIPLIGDMLVGGKGNGLIGLNYSVKGPVNDPQIHVNPLSVLTPGFLRGVFNIFDEPAPDFDKIQKERAKAKKADEDKQPAPDTAPK